MNLCGEILAKALAEGTVHVTVEGMVLQQVIESACYQALAEIQAVLRDDGLDDPACFRRIEEIVAVYERLGSGAGGRHDFG